MTDVLSPAGSSVQTAWRARYLIKLVLVVKGRGRRRRGQRFAGAERGSRVSQILLNSVCGRVCAAEHAPRGPFRVLERRHGLAEIVERGGWVLEACLSAPSQGRRKYASHQPELSYDLRSPSVHSEGSGGGRLRSLRTRPPRVPRRDIRSKIPAAPGGYYSAHRRVLGAHRVLVRRVIITVVKYH